MQTLGETLYRVVLTLAIMLATVLVAFVCFAAVAGLASPIVYIVLIPYVMMLGILLTAAIGIFANRFLRERIQSLSFAPYVRGLIWTGAAVLGMVSISAMSNAGIRALKSPWFGPRNIDVTAPKWLQGSWGSIAGIELPGIRIFIIILSFK